MNTKLPDTALLQELFNYEPDTGLVRWKVSSARRIKVGDTAGYINKRGYMVVGIGGTLYFLHRVIWKLQTGEDPMDMDIDHRDRNPSNNKWNNLRLVDRSINIHNRNLTKNKTGFTGVCKEGNRYRPQLVVKGKKYYLGLFHTPEQAHQAYLKKKQELLLT